MFDCVYVYMHGRLVEMEFGLGFGATGEVEVDLRCAQCSEGRWVGWMDGGGDVGIVREKVVCGGGIGREREMGDEKERKRERKERERLLFR